VGGVPSGEPFAKVLASWCRRFGSFRGAIDGSVTPLPDKLAYFRVLAAFASAKYLLSTVELAALLKLKPDTIAGYGDSFEDAGFAFVRAGKRKKGGTAWRVQKLA